MAVCDALHIARALDESESNFPDLAVKSGTSWAEFCEGGLQGWVPLFCLTGKTEGFGHVICLKIGPPPKMAKVSFDFPGTAAQERAFPCTGSIKGYIWAGCKPPLADLEELFERMLLLNVSFKERVARSWGLDGQPVHVEQAPGGPFEAIESNGLRLRPIHP